MRFLYPFLLTSFSCWLAGCSSSATSTASSTTAPVAPVVTKTPIAESEMPFPKLEIGMTADVIRQKLGQPVEIQAMPSPQGKAEVWVYKFEKSLGMAQVATGTRDVQTMTVGLSGPLMTTVKEPVYTMQEKRAPLTLSLLMFNGILESQKVAVGEPVVHY